MSMKEWEIYLNEKEHKEKSKPEFISYRDIRSELGFKHGTEVTRFFNTVPMLLKHVYTYKKMSVIKKEVWESFRGGFMTTEEAANFLDVKFEIMEMLLQKKHIKSFDVTGQGIRTHRYYLDEYKKNGLIPLEQLAMEMSREVALIDGYLNSSEVVFVKGRRYISRINADKLLKSIISIKLKHNYKSQTKNLEPYALFKDSMQFFRNEKTLTDTVDLFEVWARKRIKKSKQSLHQIIMQLINAFESFFTHLNKEIYQLTDKELQKILNKMKASHINELYLFINDCKSKRECCYIGDYSTKKTTQNKAAEGAYTKEEWKALTLHVIDVEKHFEEAVKIKSYAVTWLFSLLHFSLAWRLSDLKTLKPINLDILGIDDFKWFEHNTFTLEMAQTILKIVKRSMEEVLAHKNKEKLVFVIPFIFEIPTALAFVICELHRRRSGKDSESLISPKPRADYIQQLFGEDLPKFSSRKSNKALMTYGWETAVQSGKGALAYWLGGFSRSHTHDIVMPNPVTQVYLVTTNTDASVSEMAIHAFERGIFGWQVKVMIDAINGEKPMSLDDMTKEIVKVNETFSPLMVDNLSKYAATRHKQTVSLLRELMTVPKQELRQRLEDVSKLNSPSFLDHAQCLVGVKNCPFMKEVEYNLEMPCLGCKNRIDTNYIMDTVNVELFSLFDRLNNTPLEDHISRIKYTHMIKTLSHILMDFKRAYDRYDPNYVRSFVDIDQLKYNLKHLRVTKFLSIDEVSV